VCCATNGIRSEGNQQTIGCDIIETHVETKNFITYCDKINQLPFSVADGIVAHVAM
jgi:hypothetical protein